MTVVTTFAEKLEAMQLAQAMADRTFLDSLAEQQGAYVLTGQAHVEAETVWLNAFMDSAAQQRAAETWQAVKDARDALVAAVEAAYTARETTLTDAWTAIKNDEPWPPPGFE